VENLNPLPPLRRTVPSGRNDIADRASSSATSPLRVAVVGSSGFIGGAVLDALLNMGVECTSIARRPLASSGPSMRVVAADLLDVEALTDALVGVDTIVHAVSYTGPDAGRCEEVNAVGTENLVTAAAGHGIEHIVYLSTIGVYGPGPHRSVVEGELAPAPVTALSASRLTAENYVREHGGLVLRSGFVHGPRDRWFLPGLVHIVSTLGVWVDGGAARQSVVSRRDVGRLVAAIAARPLPAALRGGVRHLAHPTAVTVRELVHTAAAHGLLAPPTDSVDFEQALRIGQKRGLSARHIDLIGHDHHYVSDRIWAEAALEPSPDALPASPTSP
jgi:nucleoside-diphosphate-sugar epimerase